MIGWIGVEGGKGRQVGQGLSVIEEQAGARGVRVARRWLDRRRMDDRT